MIKCVACNRLHCKLLESHRGRLDKTGQHLEYKLDVVNNAMGELIKKMGGTI